MGESEINLELNELSSAEDFLEHFGVVYEASIVQVNRLHILQRFHDYLEGVDAMPESVEEQRLLYAGLLEGAYHDFVKSDAQTEKVFKVFHRSGPVRVEIPMTNLISEGITGAPKV